SRPRGLRLAASLQNARVSLKGACGGPFGGAPPAPSDLDPEMLTGAPQRFMLKGVSAAGAATASPRAPDSVAFRQVQTVRSKGGLPGPGKSPWLLGLRGPGVVSLLRHQHLEAIGGQNISGGDARQSAGMEPRQMRGAGRGGRGI